jgi:hypothetical protein
MQSPPSASLTGINHYSQHSTGNIAALSIETIIKCIPAKERATYGLSARYQQKDASGNNK